MRDKERGFSLLRYVTELFLVLIMIVIFILSVGTVFKDLGSKIAENVVSILPAKI